MKNNRFDKTIAIRVNSEFFPKFQNVLGWKCSKFLRRCMYLASIDSSFVTQVMKDVRVYDLEYEYE